MSEFVGATFGNSLTEFTTNFNAVFAPLLGNNILSINFLGQDQARLNSKELAVAFRYDDLGTTISNPYKVQAFEGASASEVRTSAQAFITANNTFFFGPLQVVLIDAGRNTLPYIGFLVYNESSSEGASNWAASGGGGGGGGGTEIQVTGISSQTVVDSYDSTVYESMLWSITVTRTDSAGPRYSEVINTNHDGSDVYDESMGTVITPGAVGDISVDVNWNAGTVELRVTPTAGTWKADIKRLHEVAA